MSVFSLLIYALAPRLHLYADAVDPLRQFALILTGVAASAIFLPELSSDLWTIKRDQIRSLIPDARRESLTRELISAESDDSEWDEVVYNQALGPLLQASRHPWQIVKNMNYTIQVHLHNSTTIDGNRLRFHSVETTSNSHRVLPPVGADGYYTMSVARTQQALIAEFDEPGCLAREFVPLADAEGTLLVADSWRSAAAALCRVSVTVNGQVQELMCDLDGPNPDLIRWRFRPEYPEVGQRVPVQMMFDYPMSISEDRFPVYFLSYYCAEATTVNMKVYGLGDQALLTCDSFFGRGLGNHNSREQVVSTIGSLAQQISFSTGRDSILWPGSGVVFNWHSCPGRGAPSD